MTYFLGKDVQIWFLTENDAKGVAALSYEATVAASALAVGNFANKLHADSLGATYLYADVTAIDITLGTVDENITYYGKRSTLNAEIKKDSSISITRKKDDNVWDVIFNGPQASGSAFDSDKLDIGARWGVCSTPAPSFGLSAGEDRLSNGLINPKECNDHGSDQSADSNYGYRIVLQLKSPSGTGNLGDEFIALPNCTFTEHTVTLNTDGISEETAVFQTAIDPVIGYRHADLLSATRASNI
jgi:hypothetical protein